MAHAFLNITTSNYSNHNVTEVPILAKTLLRVEEVAKRLNISVARCYELARQNVLPAVRLGRQVRFDPDALDEFIRSGGQALEGGWRRTAS